MLSCDHRIVCVVALSIFPCVCVVALSIFPFQKECPRLPRVSARFLFFLNGIFHNSLNGIQDMLGTRNRHHFLFPQQKTTANNNSGCLFSQGNSPVQNLLPGLSFFQENPQENRFHDSFFPRKTCPLKYMYSGFSFSPAKNYCK